MNTEFNFFDAAAYTSSLKCAVQKTGKIGFTDYTQRKLEMKAGMSARIGVAGTKEQYDHLVIQFLDTVEPDAFKLNKAGNYYYLNPKALLDELNIPYKTQSIQYDMQLIDRDRNIYKLNKKEGRVQNEESE